MIIYQFLYQSKMFIMIELTFLSELMLIRQANKKAQTNKGFKFQSNVCNGCHDVLIMPVIF